MKVLLFISFIVLVDISLFSCSKNTTTTTNSMLTSNDTFVVSTDTVVSLINKWYIADDSSYSAFGPVSHSSTNFVGTPDDYFDFRTDGNVYTKEGSVMDTMGYQLVSDTSIIINSFGWVFNGITNTSIIEALTAHNVTIYAPNSINPGGVYDRTLILKR